MRGIWNLSVTTASKLERKRLRMAKRIMTMTRYLRKWSMTDCKSKLLHSGFGVQRLAVAVRLKNLRQFPISLLHRLRNHPGVADNRHETGVAYPPGHHMVVNMVFNTGAGHTSQIQ